MTDWTKVFGLAALTLAGSSQAGLVTIPGASLVAGDSLITTSECNAEKQAWYGDGRTIGRSQAFAECIADPANCGCADGVEPCGVSIDSLFSDAEYGETEPNDYSAAADAMTADVIYWGQSYGEIDQDWFQINTQEPNQIIEIYFSVPFVSMEGAWNVSLRDAGGNIYAQFEKIFQPADDTDASTGVDNSTQPVFVSSPGAYFVVVTPSVAAIPLSSDFYNIMAMVDFSSSDQAPSTPTFNDTETEPNDDYLRANMIGNGVPMYAMLHSTLAGDAISGWGLQTEQDWFRYASSGNEQITFSFCGREACTAGEGRAWRVTLMNSVGDIMTSFSATEAKTVQTGFATAGEYYVQVVSELKYNADGTVETRCVQYTDPVDGGEAICMRYAPVTTVATDNYNFTLQATGTSSLGGF
jgi:hypothetical protein